MKLYIKNMVCDRCKMAVQNVLDKNSLSYNHIELGEVEFTTEPKAEQLQKFKKDIEELGFELIEDRTARIISKIKKVVMESVREESNKKIKLSAEVSEALSKDYNSLSNIFSSVEGTTIEQFATLQKIEFVKELLVYDELSLSEIAHKLRYSSVQHLSNQFKKVTGLTPSHFRKIGEQKHQPLDHI